MFNHKNNSTIRLFLADNNMLRARSDFSRFTREWILLTIFNLYLLTIISDTLGIEVYSLLILLISVLLAPYTYRYIFTSTIRRRYKRCITIVRDWYSVFYYHIVSHLNLPHDSKHKDPDGLCLFMDPLERPAYIEGMVDIISGMVIEDKTKDPNYVGDEDLCERIADTLNKPDYDMLLSIYHDEVPDVVIRMIHAKYITVCMKPYETMMSDVINNIATVKLQNYIESFNK